MPWSAPLYTGGVVWEDYPSQHTPLNAADLNLEENAEATYSAVVGQSVANYVDAETLRAEVAEGLLAPTASPAFSGSPTAPTQNPFDNSTKLATTAYTDLATAVELARAEAAEATLIPQSQRGVANGVGTLDANGLQPVSQVPVSTVTTTSPKFASAIFTPRGGGLDDAASVGAAATSGAYLLMGQGTFHWNSSVPQLGNGGQRIGGGGRSRTVIALSNAAPSAFDCDIAGQRDQLVSDITIEDMTIDCAALSGFTDDRYAILGNLTTNDHGRGVRTSFARITLRRVKAINLPTIGPWFQGFALVSWEDGGAGAGTLCTMTDIVLDDVEVIGGAGGGYIGGIYSGATIVNCFIDRVSVPKFRHDAVVQGAISGAGLQIGAHAYCGKITIGEMHSDNSSDVGLEIDQARDVSVQALYCTDAHDVGMILHNFHYAVGSPQLPSQVANIGLISHRTLNQSSVAPALACNLMTDSVRYGDVNVDMIKVSSEFPTGPRPHAFDAGNTSINSIKIGEIIYTDTTVNDTTTGNGWTVVQLTPNSTLGQRVKIGFLRVKIAGTYSAAPIQLVTVTTTSGTPGRARLEIDGTDIDISGTLWSTNNTYHIGMLGADATSILTVSGYIKNHRVKASPSQYFGSIYFASTQVLTLKQPFEIDNADFAGQASGGSGEIYCSSVGGATNSGALRVNGPVLWISGTPQAASTPTVTTGTWTYTNTNTHNGGVAGMLYLWGGTVSSVTVRGLQVAASSPCAVYLASGDSAVVANTVAPSARFVPDF